MPTLTSAVRAQPINAVLIFAPTIFLSAWSLFLIQPLFAKMALPLLGGSPNVWNIAMVFFQATLLLGYLYAHLLVRLFRFRTQLALHCALLLAAFVALPVGIDEVWRDVPAELPALWLLALLVVCVGLPFFAVAANAPLLQHWFMLSGHRDAGDPYFLYAASNVGSILALLGYPFLIEPSVSIATQSWIWTAGYAVLAMMILACGLQAGGAGTPDRRAADTCDRGSSSVGWPERLRWIALAFVPAGLLLSVTTYITTDLVAVPLLWVVPLALYLLTYVLVFARRQWLRPRWMLGLQLALLPLAALSAFLTISNFAYWQFGLALAAFFVTAMVCHGELAKRRPDARHLTEFYLFMSLGGVLGGAFTALLAPVLFDRVLEYPLLLALAGFLRPGSRDGDAGTQRRSRVTRPRTVDILLPGACILAILVADLRVSALSTTDRMFLFLILAGLAVAWGSSLARPLRFGLTVLAVSVLSHSILYWAGRTGDDYAARSFFGVYRVATTEDGRYRLFTHGSTMHGAQHTAPSRRHEANTYYHHRSGIGRIFGAVREHGLPVRSVGAVGLGIGEIACYRRPGQRWSFYEIDPLVVRIARDPALFRYLSDCAPDARIVVGDGRRSLELDTGARYGLLILDAFTSDAIPLHLLTREAFALYLSRLAEGGVIAVHISNRHLNLRPVIARLAVEVGLVGRVMEQRLPSAIRRTEYRLNSVWVALARDEAALDLYARPTDDPTAARWRPLEPHPRLRLWTDDYSNIWSVIE